MHADSHAIYDHSHNKHGSMVDRTVAGISKIGLAEAMGIWGEVLWLVTFPAQVLVVYYN